MTVSQTKEVKLRQRVNGLVPGYGTTGRISDSHPGSGIFNTPCFLRDDPIKHNIVTVYDTNPRCKKHGQHKGSKTTAEYEDQGHPRRRPVRTKVLNLQTEATLCHREVLFYSLENTRKWVNSPRRLMKGIFTSH